MSQLVSSRRDHDGFTRVDMVDYYDDAELENLYQWLDRVPLTRPKKNLAKDFSDGVLVAEVIKYYFPRMVDLHNYSPAHADKQKMENWYHLNRKVLYRLDLDLSDEVIRALVKSKKKVVERVLMLLRLQIDKAMEKMQRHKERVKHLQASSSKASSPFPTGRELIPHKSVSPRSIGANPVIPHSHPSRVGYSQTEFTLPSLPPAINNVDRSLLEEKEQESMAKNETIYILNDKLTRLEQLLHLKDMRIEDLESRLNQVRSLNYSRRVT
ncbi:hypothetical protein C0Q70_09714 [Pomacea canaliculata]|uniref:Calponin-homology (CH) domain-containing protein n=2 Tax=Pomacea canaliculata TaxID=400727 RepID=A0A2T7PAL3_POMCA|nr:sperm flagellar protein 1-like isoform X1 [Pomacea canaliculata]PVD30448.1 hypothetical protein C0Q70_09714 [Pomacea canaliculata]